MREGLSLNETMRRRVAMLRWAGALAIVWFVAVLGWMEFGARNDSTRIFAQTLLWGGGAFVAAALLLDGFLVKPSAEGGLVVLGVSTLPFLALVVFFGAGHALYSRLAVAVAWAVSAAWLLAGYHRYIQTHVLRLAVLEEGVLAYLTQAAQSAAKSHTRIVLSGNVAPDALIGFDGVVIDRFAPKSPEMRRVLTQLKLANVRIYSADHVYELLTGRVSLPHVEDSFMDDAYGHVLYALFKRLLDIAGAVALGALLIAPLALIALLIRLESPGPALFMQDRVGQGGRSFRMWKLRTMRRAEDRVADAGAAVTTDDDPRITRLGRRLRQYRIDELPQLWNVLRGDMSLIGPRPEWNASAQAFFENIPHYHYRHLVKPGISGWAQVNQGHVTDVNDAMIKLEYDLYYVKHLSLPLDLVIAAKTLRTVFTGFGAR